MEPRGTFFLGGGRSWKIDRNGFYEKRCWWFVFLLLCCLFLLLVGGVNGEGILGHLEWATQIINFAVNDWNTSGAIEGDGHSGFARDFFLLEICTFIG